MPLSLAIIILCISQSSAKSDLLNRMNASRYKTGQSLAVIRSSLVIQSLSLVIATENVLVSCAHFPLALNNGSSFSSRISHMGSCDAPSNQRALKGPTNPQSAWSMIWGGELSSSELRRLRGAGGMAVSKVLVGQA